MTGEVPRLKRKLTIGQKTTQRSELLDKQAEKIRRLEEENAELRGRCSAMESSWTFEQLVDRLIDTCHQGTGRVGNAYNDQVKAARGAVLDRHEADADHSDCS